MLDKYPYGGKGGLRERVRKFENQDNPILRKASLGKAEEKGN